MDFNQQIVPALVILAANLLSGKHSSLRWETVTAIFGWGTIAFLSISIALYVVTLSDLANYAVQASMFCLLTALSRDYERILHPLMPWNRD